jgi:uncharacterized protein YciI
VLFALYCIDKPVSESIRQDNRPAHVDYLQSWGVAIRLAGPLLSEDSERMIGSLIVLEAADRTEVDRFIAGDPYGVAGLFASLQVHPFKQVFGA